MKSSTGMDPNRRLQHSNFFLSYNLTIFVYLLGLASNVMQSFSVSNVRHYFHLIENDKN